MTAVSPRPIVTPPHPARVTKRGSAITHMLAVTLDALPALVAGAGSLVVGTAAFAAHRRGGRPALGAR